MPDTEGKARIKVLPRELQNRIAAGEVVERPASVLKELVENSLDAEADRIQVDIASGGQSLISVQDNGLGLSGEEMELALTRHATSKIRSAEDLFRLPKLGFRGEALPSIASVSRMRIDSIASGHSEGYSLEVEFGSASSLRPAPVREGTRVEVRDLFLNTPARLKFLKKQSTEAKKCLETLQRIALVHTDCAFRLTSQGRELLSFSRGQSLLLRLQALWPEQITSSLLPVYMEREGACVTGYAGHPETAQGRGDRILLFVNNRPVQDKLLQSALKQAYSGKLLSREHPQAVLFLELPSEEVDVNVHPAKSEVKFREEKAVFSLVHSAVEQSLKQGVDSAASGQLQEADLKPPPPFGTGARRVSIPGLSEKPTQEYSPGRSTRREAREAEAPRNMPSTEQEAESSSFGVTADSSRELGPQIQYLGQVGSSYLLLLTGEKLLIVDQHAAHERVLFHSYASQEGSPGVQRLGLPLRLRMHPSEWEVFEEAAVSLRKLGFALQRENEENLSVQGIPQHMDSSQAEQFLRRVFREGHSSMQGIWTLMACKNAIKTGERLAEAEALQLLQTWLQCPDRDYCPHGRPVSARLAAKDLESLFKRDK